MIRIDWRDIMKTIYIVNILNIITPYQLVRCFKNANKTFLVYTDNKRSREKDTFYTNNYVAVKAADEMWEEPTKQEWDQFQTIIKKVAEESSLGIVTSVQDIPVEERSSFIVTSNKSFKVIPFYHHLIASNFNYQELHISEEQSEKATNPANYNSLQYQYEIGSVDMPEINYVKEYYNLKKENYLQSQKIKKIKEILDSDFDS